MDKNHCTINPTKMSNWKATDDLLSATTTGWCCLAQLKDCGLLKDPNHKGVFTQKFQFTCREYSWMCFCVTNEELQTCEDYLEKAANKCAYLGTYGYFEVYE